MASHLSPSGWRDSGQWLDFNGLKLFVRVCGGGEPVLVLHGFPTASYDFSRLIPLVEDRFRFFCFDYPGFGFSDKPTVYPYSLFTYADAAEAVTAHFGLERVSIVAHDIGDSVALELLRRGRPTVERLTLLNGSVLIFNLQLSTRLMVHPLIGTLIVRLGLFRRASFALAFRQLFFEPLSPQTFDAFWSLMGYNGGVKIYHRLIRYVAERLAYEQIWLTALANHSAPLTVVWGQADPVAVPAIADEIMARRPDADDFRLAEVAHYPHWEAPEQVATILRRVFK